MSTRTIIEIILGILSLLGTYFIYTKLTILIRSSKKKMTAKDTEGQVLQVQDHGQIVQDHRQFYGNERLLVIYMNNPSFNLGSPVPGNLTKNLMDSISEVGHKYKVPEEKIKVAQKIVGDSTGSFGDLSTAFLPVSGSFACASESSQEGILSDILRITDLDDYIKYELPPIWKCQQCGHINSLEQANCQKCNAPKK